MNQISHNFRKRDFFKKYMKPFIKLNKNVVSTVSYTDFIIFIGAILIARNESFTATLGMVSALWATLVILKYKYLIPIFLGASIGLGSTGNTKAIIGFWAFCMCFSILKKLKIKKKSIPKAFLVVVSAVIAYSIKVLGDIHVIHLPIYVLSTLFLTQIFFIALNDSVLKITKYSNNDWRLICKIIFLAAAISGVGPLVILNLSVVNIIKFLSIMIVAQAGCYPAALLGIVLGSGLLSGSFNAISAGQACFLGFILGVCKDYSKLTYVAVAIASNIIWLNQGSFMDIKISLLEMTLASIIWLVIKKFMPKSLIFEPFKTSPIPVKEKPQKVEDSWVQIAQVCDEIAVVLSTSEYEPIENTHLLQIIEWTGVSLCQNCAYYEQCWSQDLFLTYHKWKDFLISLDQNKDNINSIYQVLPQHCPSKNKLVDVFDQHLNLIRVELFWRNKLQECSSLAVDRLSDFSDMARSLATGSNQKKELEKELIAQIKRELQEQAVNLNKINIRCNNRKRIISLTMGSCYDYKSCSNIIVPTVNKIIGGKLVNSLYNCSKHTKSLSCSCELEYAPSVEVEYGVASLSPSGISGDSYWLDHLTDGRFIALLSDGMGSGYVARKDSKYAIDLLQKLLKTGLDIKSLIKLLNTALALGIQQDSFVTIDGVLVDCFKGCAQLIKIGASYTCLKRDRDVKLWKSSTLPVGVFPEIDIDQYDISLQKDDILIMLSDGIVDNQRIVDSEKWLINIIKELPKITANEIADYIIKIAKRHCNVEIKDDMTVVVLKIV
ncbi:SpoIIE family protein phosphatase [Clostridium sp. 'deep sea']|uniref:SpoIIE family protein phosphatase n=1 Tax=Clostridium sp. 'deep sea' TaxID=2779445 RepID=UPI001896A405|nr:SpoIIE family protein phosphatase [Clostridium sp. 'deep sea']QOR34523.1 SpoIIE family protein phosphatase [Clostridium sp. 'deep sea']